jgi:hypothetical protein
MPRTLAPIPEGVQIVDQFGAITTFFRLRWQSLIDGFLFTPAIAVASSDAPNPTAAIPTTAVYTTRSGGRYRVSYRMRKTVADGVSSSLTFTLGWVEGGLAQTKVFAALALDTVFAEQDGVIPLRVDGGTDITFAIAYASNTPNLMAFNYDVTVEQLA